MSRSRGPVGGDHRGAGRRADLETSSTARSKAAALAWDGLEKPLIVRTNCRAAARISSSLAGGFEAGDRADVAAHGRTSSRQEFGGLRRGFQPSASAAAKAPPPATGPPDTGAEGEEVGDRREVGGERRGRGRPRRPPAPRSSRTTIRRGRAAPASPSPRPLAPTGPKLDVVGADLARGHAVVARGVGVGADDGVGAERLADGADLAGAVAEMHAVEAEAGDQAEVVGDHQRHVAGVRHRAERVGGARDLVLGRRWPAPAAGRRCRRRRGAPPAGRAGRGRRPAA